MKGKDMILSDFLSWQRNDDSDPSEIIPTSFNAYNILEENRNSGMREKNEGKFLIQTLLKPKQVALHYRKYMELERIRS